MFRYTMKHKWYVFTYCLVWMIPFRGIVHDWSKFIPRVFRAYKRWFYGTWPSADEVVVMAREGIDIPQWNEISAKVEFDLAWNLHQKLEAHHWQRWVLIEDDRPLPRALEMPYKEVKHMVADWLGTARMHSAKADTVANCRMWYLDRRYKLVLHPRTRAAVEYLLSVYTDMVASDNMASVRWEFLRNRGENSPRRITR